MSVYDESLVPTSVYIKDIGREGKSQSHYYCSYLLTISIIF